MLNVFQPSGMSLFTTPKDLVDAQIAADLNSLGITLQKQAECGNFTLNGLPACDFTIQSISGGIDSKDIRSNYRRCQWNRISCSIFYYPRPF